MVGLVIYLNDSRAMHELCTFYFLQSVIGDGDRAKFGGTVTLAGLDTRF
jgi:hypothetical protein